MKKQVRRNYSTRRFLLARELEQIPCYGEYCNGKLIHSTKFVIKKIKTRKGVRLRRDYICRECKLKKFFATPKTAKQTKRKNDLYYKRYPEKKIAHVALNSALRKGDVVKEPCVVCGNPKSAGHHFDYSEKHHLDVVWLCQICHNAYHKGSLEVDKIEMIKALEDEKRNK